MYRLLQSKPKPKPKPKSKPEPKPEPKPFTPKTYAIQHIRTVTMYYRKPPKDVQSCFRAALQLVTERDADGKMSTLTVSADRIIVSDLKDDYIYDIRQVFCIGVEPKYGTKCGLVAWDSHIGIVVHVFDCQFATNLLLDAKDAFNEALKLEQQGS